MGQFYSNFNKDDKKDEHSMNNYKKFFEEYEHNPPSLQESLNQMFKSANIEDKNIKLFTDEVMDKCKLCIDKNFDEIKTKFNKISIDDAYIICSYTVELKNHRYCPDRIVNGYLSKNGSEIAKISKYLYILLKSLRKLPIIYLNYLYFNKIVDCIILSFTLDIILLKNIYILLLSRKFFLKKIPLIRS